MPEDFNMPQTCRCIQIPDHAVIAEIIAQQTYEGILKVEFIIKEVIAFRPPVNSRKEYMEMYVELDINGIFFKSDVIEAKNIITAPT